MKNKFSLKIISMILVIFTLLTAFTIKVNAEEAEETSQEVGWVHITVDVETNRPVEFRDYNFYVNIVNKETWEWNLADIYYDNGYKARITLPYGSYYIAEAGVEKDYLGEFALTTGQEFTLDEETHAVDIQLGFTTEHIVTPFEPPVEEPIPDEPVEEVPEIEEPVVEEQPEEPTPEVEQEQVQEPEQEEPAEDDYIKEILVSFLKFLIIIVIVCVIVYIYKRNHE